MAELTTPDDINEATSCCAAGNAAGTSGADIREQVRQRYAEAALSVTTSEAGSGCCAPSEAFDGGSDVFGAALYALGDQQSVPDTAALASLGCDCWTNRWAWRSRGNIVWQRAGASP